VILEARILFNGDEAFSVNATIDFGHGHLLYAQAVNEGSIAAPRTTISATGAPVTCNFVLSDTGEFTDVQLGMLLLA
jgi:hypothetical protein